MTYTTTRRRSGARPRGSRPVRRAKGGVRRRRVAALLGAVLVVGVAALVVTRLGGLDDVVREVTLPLRHEDIIRQQAADKDLDPALIAAVIYQESKFRDQTSPAGAKGLMQILPDTARFIARKSGGTSFEIRDLATPQINIAYGSFYLRYLLERYEGHTNLAVAAYNAGHENVDAWVRRAGGAEDFEANRHIRFPQTKAYVEGVDRRRDEYREHYAEELGL